jgi:hypothetical protein
MDTDKLIDNLQKAELPERVPLTFKNGLRRQLLNSDHFQRVSARRSVIKYITSAAITAAATAMIILYMITPPTFSSAKELLDHIESAYRQMDDGRMHYLRTLFKRMSGRTPLEEEAWTYGPFRQFSAITRNAVTGEILGHTIIKEDKTFSRSDDLFKFKFDIVEKPAPPNGQGQSGKRETKDLRVMVIPLTEDSKIVQVYIFNDAWAPEMFAKRTPWEIIASLKSDSLVSYAGKEITAEGDAYEILEVLHNRDLYLFKLNADQKPNELIPKLLDQIERGETPLSEKADIRETIKIDIKANKIYQIIHSVRQKNREIERMELTFVEEKYLEYDPTVFDAARYGLKEVLHNE